MVRRLLEEGWSVTAVANTFKVSTRTVRKWLARFQSMALVTTLPAHFGKYG